MSKPLTALAAAFCLSVTAFGVHAQKARPEQVRAHLSFLASDALQGRKSASRDEAIAAAYVGAQYESFGLQFAPTLSGFVQAAEVVSPQLDGQASLQLMP